MYGVQAIMATQCKFEAICLQRKEREKRRALIVTAAGQVCNQTTERVLWEGLRQHRY